MYRDGIARFAEQYIHEEVGATIPYDEFQKQVKRSFESRAETVPDNTWVGQSLPEWLEVDNSGETIEDARWVYDPDLLSPEHTVVNPDDSKTEAWQRAMRVRRRQTKMRAVRNSSRRWYQIALDKITSSRLALVRCDADGTPGVLWVRLGRERRYQREPRRNSLPVWAPPTYQL